MGYIQVDVIHPKSDWNYDMFLTRKNLGNNLAVPSLEHTQMELCYLPQLFLADGFHSLTFAIFDVH